MLTDQQIRQGATRLGIREIVYRVHVEAGFKHCSRCRAWQPLSEFGPHKLRPSGLDTVCRQSARAAAREWQRKARAR